MPDDHVCGISGIGSDISACGTVRRASNGGDSVVHSGINVRQKAVVG